MTTQSPQKIRFIKMHGAGNDFIVLNGITNDLGAVTKEQWRKLAHRQLGVGADQILIVEKATRPDADFRYRIFNADGGEVEQCGNGSRCFARYIHEQGLSAKNPLRVEVAHTVITLEALADGQIKVNMGAPIFEPQLIPFDPTGLPTKLELHETLYALPISRKAGAHADWIAAISMGNPHAIQVVDDVDSAPVGIEGAQIEANSAFPQRVNAGYMQILHEHAIRLRVYERGAGETLACGTGACAAVVSGIRRGLLLSPVRVETRGGILEIVWPGMLDGQPQTVEMYGPAMTVFEGETSL